MGTHGGGDRARSRRQGVTGQVQLPVRWTRAAACPGVLRIRLHDMRHTHETLLLEGGETIKYVAERLGDREDTVVETYAHVTPRMRSSAVSKVRGFFRVDLSLGDEGMAMPHVETGGSVDRDPPVTPRPVEGRSGSPGGA